MEHRDRGMLQAVQPIGSGFLPFLGPPCVFARAFTAIIRDLVPRLSATVGYAHSADNLFARFDVNAFVGLGVAGFGCHLPPA